MPYRLAVLAILTVVTAAACAGPEAEMEERATPELGPVDGRDLPGVELDRVGVGDPAPDFTLTSFAGEPLTLSANRGVREVILVFFRGHW